MSGRGKEPDYSSLLMEFKQVCALLFITGVVLGSYVIIIPESSIFLFIFTILVVIYAAYLYYKKEPGKVGIFLLVLAIIWVLASIGKYFHLY